MYESVEEGERGAVDWRASGGDGEGDASTDWGREEWEVRLDRGGSEILGETRSEILGGASEILGRVSETLAGGELDSCGVSGILGGGSEILGGGSEILIGGVFCLGGPV